MSISLPCFNRYFTPSWSMTLLSLIFIALFVKLGFWQIHRGAEKAAMLAAEAKMRAQPFKLWQADKPMPKQYQPIAVQGRYLDSLFFLDNQHQDHQFGYHVLSPLVLDNGAVVLVDRGWVAGAVDRSQLPAVSIPDKRLLIQGMAWYPSAGMWSLGPEIEKKSDKMIVIETVKPDLVGQLLQKTVYPFIIRLEPSAADGFVRSWPVVSMPPAKHYAYAVQWFAMASVILILFVALNLKKAK